MLGPPVMATSPYHSNIEYDWAIGVVRDVWCLTKMMGIVLVASLAISVERVTTTATCRLTRLAAKAGNQSGWPSAPRYSTATFLPPCISGKEHCEG